MSNKAVNSKESIIVDAKELLAFFDKVTWHLPNARRQHGALKRFEDAGYSIIHNYTIAQELKAADERDEKRRYIAKIIGAYGEMLAAFEIMMFMKDMTQKSSRQESSGELHLFSDTAKLTIAQYLDRIGVAAKKWKNANRILASG